MQRNRNLKMCLRSINGAADTSEIAKVCICHQFLIALWEWINDPWLYLQMKIERHMEEVASLAQAPS